MHLPLITAIVTKGPRLLPAATESLRAGRNHQPLQMEASTHGPQSVTEEMPTLITGSRASGSQDNANAIVLPRGAYGNGRYHIPLDLRAAYDGGTSCR